MTQIDFAVAFLLIITIVSYAIISVSNKLNFDFNLFTSRRLEESASMLVRQLFYVHDEKSLTSPLNKVQALFKEVGSYPHTENLEITLTPAVNNIHVYDSLLNEIPTTVIDNGSNATLSLSLSFSSDEKKYASIMYNGSTDSIYYTSPWNNVTSVIVSEDEVYVLSNERCSSLKSLSYDQARSMFGFKENFNLVGCDFGPSPPESANVIAKSVPVLIEHANGTVYSDFARILVW